MQIIEINKRKKELCVKLAIYNNHNEKHGKKKHKINVKFNHNPSHARGEMPLRNDLLYLYIYIF